MHPEIAEFPNRMFYRREKLEPVPCPHQLESELSYTLPSEDALDDLLKEHRMIFLPSRFCKEPNVSDKINANEAEIVVDMLRRIHRFYGDRFDAQKTVGVIVPYRNQIAMVRKGIEKLGIPELEKISIDTVERYQAVSVMSSSTVSPSRTSGSSIFLPATALWKTEPSSTAS